jgi:co-chaperonin GroES (HSP10)
MPPMTMKHSKDPKDELLAKIGDVSGVAIYNNAVLVATYVRPKTTASGIHLPDSVVEEDRFQGKAALIVKMGPQAFKDESGRWFADADVKEGDWIALRPSDGWSISINGTPCRVIDDTAVRLKIDRPDRVW